VPAQPQAEPEVVRVLKADALGRVELVRCAGDAARAARGRGRRLPALGRVARVLLARERRALRALEGLAGVARVLSAAADDAWLVRSFVPGTPLCLAASCRATSSSA
jgi:aminoglycoside phosphotransferase